MTIMEPIISKAELTAIRTALKEHGEKLRALDYQSGIRHDFLAGRLGRAETIIGVLFGVVLFTLGVALYAVFH